MWQVGLVVNAIGCSTDDPGSISGGDAEKGNFNFLAAFQCYGWHL